MMKSAAQIQLFSRVTFLDKLLFTKHLSMMIKSGITVAESLSILSSQTKAGAFKNIIDDVYADIQNGKSLAKAIGMHPKVFNTFYVSLVDVGEESGALDINLIYLASQLSKEYEFKKKVKGALMYPVIVLIAAFIVGISVSLFVLPKLIDLFKGFDVKLPLTTQLLLGFAAVMRDFGVYIGIGLIILIISLKFFVSTKALKPLWHRTLLAIPIFGKIIANSELANFTRSLGVMIKSGLPLTSALEIEANMSSNAVFNKYTKSMLESLTKGQSLSKELSSGHYKMIPLIAAKMIAVGEETGKLDETLLYLGDFFESEVDDATANLTTLLEPIMLLSIGLIVAFLALAIISPIYQLTGSIKR